MSRNLNIRVNFGYNTPDGGIRIFTKFDAKGRASSIVNHSGTVGAGEEACQSGIQARGELLG